MQVAATLRYARISPQKCRLVADVIRGKSVDDAIRTLTFSPKKSARIVKKVLEFKEEFDQGRATVSVNVLQFLSK